MRYRWNIIHVYGKLALRGFDTPRRLGQDVVVDMQSVYVGL
jgi:hypothetical protein